MCVLDIEWWKFFMIFFMIYMNLHSVDLKSEMNICTCTCIVILNIYSLHHYFLFLSDLTDVAKAVDCCNSTSSTHLCFRYHIKSKSQDVSPPLCYKYCIYTCRRWEQCVEPWYFVFKHVFHHCKVLWSYGYKFFIIEFPDQINNSN